MKLNIVWLLAIWIVVHLIYWGGSLFLYPFFSFLGSGVLVILFMIGAFLYMHFYLKNGAWISNGLLIGFIWVVFASGVLFTISIFANKPTNPEIFYFHDHFIHDSNHFVIEAEIIAGFLAGLVGKIFSRLFPNYKDVKSADS